ncbi:MAG: hypothetical protein WC824_06000 [Bacteroidota bacterium]
MSDLEKSWGKVAFNYGPTYSPMSKERKNLLAAKDRLEAVTGMAEKTLNVMLKRVAKNFRVVKTFDGSGSSSDIKIYIKDPPENFATRFESLLAAWFQNKGWKVRSRGDMWYELTEPNGVLQGEIHPADIGDVSPHWPILTLELL